MIDLNNLEEIKKLDKSNMLGSIEALPQQCEQTWEEVKKIKPPQGYKGMSNILVAGMGGSSFGGRIIKSLYFDSLKIPLDILSDYHPPAYLTGNSLVVAVSYSGNTEETITALGEAYQKGAKILGLTCHKDSRLDNFCRLNGIPCLFLDPQFNPSGQPRTGSGYMITGTLGWLNKLGFIPLLELQIKETIFFLKENLPLLKAETVTHKNPAKKLALGFFKKNIILVAAEFLAGVLYPLRNPIHETGKNFATDFSLPDLNHHLLESLPYPSLNKENLIYVFLESNFYSGPLKKRIELTKAVIVKNNLKVESIKLAAKNKFGQVFEAIQLGSFTAFYLALLNGVDPGNVPWVTYFQKTFRRK